MFSKLKAELDAVMARDPAARSRAEVYFLYSGFKAVRSYRKANWFFRHNMKFIARYISQRARRKTGIEIHPGATIGKNLFIDHGMGVTLGGTGKDQGKRHPTLGNDVLVGAGAKVLGPFRVGDNARVAAGAVVLDAVPDNATAVGVPARIVRVGGKRVMDNSTLDQIHVADPVAQEMCRMRLEIERLHGELNSCRREKSKLTAQKAEKNKEE